MATTKKKGGETTTWRGSGPTIYAATLQPQPSGGGVVRGREISEEDAVTERRLGRDVVVCGPNPRDNRELAKQIETQATGRWKRCPPHFNAGPDALPHYQPDPRPPAGHCFYETDHRKAKP